MSEIWIDIGMLAAAGLAIWLLVKLLAGPIKFIIKLIIHAALGLVLLLVVNFVGSWFDFSLPYSALNVGIATVGGIPGVLLLVLIKLLF